MFEWDEIKNERNIKNHKIDFNDVKEIWQGCVLEKKSPQKYGEFYV